ncbi:hypothetical protein VFPPC_15668 [Pochonia chlamydosporia 170]|uniref:Uncharacterized protein n=1 Tax=Pochonia chlamydosporia 170 TaxID=1380566 RepID=A0A179G011_METCM|nr:hypothetical protein VFPPC_15668 [Pochonia chlamydosporia 170]OAQ71236.2 hypothetical protein VFPPC_15668 [Pochonia chlamydosporia 170]
MLYTLHCCSCNVKNHSVIPPLVFKDASRLNNKTVGKARSFFGLPLVFGCLGPLFLFISPSELHSVQDTKGHNRLPQ